jgi:CheY-like chemotaxis protein
MDLHPVAALPDVPFFDSAALPAILVVDDDPAILHTLSLVLTDEGYTVLTARNGHEALTCLHHQRPALVLLDLHLPVMNGWDVLDTLRVHGPTVPVVVMTAGTTARAEAVRHGAAAYVHKPFELDDLLGAVARLVG